jgi:hypothetical protein
VKVAAVRLTSLAGILAYSVAGSVSSMLVGALLGLLGQTLLPTGLRSAEILAVPVAGALLLRELRIVSFPMPEWKRQTNGTWRRRFHPTVAAAFWGTDLGLTVTTRQTFSGAWPVLALAFSLAEPRMSALAVLCFWLGRAASVWIMPLLLKNASDSARLLKELSRHHSELQRINVIGLAWGIGVMALLMLETRGV